MNKLLFLDLETTGLEEKDRICELALIVQEEDNMICSSSLCKSSKKISTQAMSLHHITNEMIKEAPGCEQSQAYRWLADNNQKENVLITHNMDLHLSMLAKEGFVSKMSHVDTQRCTKALINECEHFALQFLRYELLLYRDEGKLSEELGVSMSAHRALSDACHVKLLYHTLLEYATLSQLVEISSKPILMQKLPFGKYSGRYIEEIVDLDRSYIQWMLEGIKDMDEDLKYSISYYTQGET